jgi:hypothetical protein
MKNWQVENQMQNDLDVIRSEINPCMFGSNLICTRKRALITFGERLGSSIKDLNTNLLVNFDHLSAHLIDRVLPKTGLETATNGDITRKPA